MCGGSRGASRMRRHMSKTFQKGTRQTLPMRCWFVADGAPGHGPVLLLLESAAKLGFL